MKTPYNEIVSVNDIGSQINPISLNSILKKANEENHRQRRTKRGYCSSALMSSRTSWITERWAFLAHTETLSA